MTKLKSVASLGKALKGRIKKKKGNRNITHNEFLGSRSFLIDSQKYLRSITQNYKTLLEFDFLTGRNDTDGKLVTISPIREHLDKYNLTLKQKVMLIRETIAHEGFHILYTDFKVLDFINAKFKEDKRRRKILFDYFNILEDGAINIAGMHKFPGLVPYFKMSYDLYSNMVTSKEVEKRGKIHAHQYAILWYAHYKGKHHSTFEDEKLQEVYEQCKPIVLKAIVAETSQQRYEYAEQVFNMMEPFIQDVEEGKDEYDEKEFDMHIVPDDGSAGGSAQKTKKLPKEAIEALKKELEKYQKELEKQKQEQEGKTEGEGMDIEMDGQSKGGSQKGDSENEGKGSSSKNEGEGDDSEGKENDSSSKNGKDQQGQEQPNPSSSPQTGNNGEESEGEEDGEGKSQSDAEADAQLDEFLEEFERKLDADVKNITKKVEKEMDEQEQQQQREDAMREHMKQTKYDVRHKNIKITHKQMNKSIEKSTKDRYNKQFQVVKNISRTMIKHLEKMLRYNEDEKHTGEVRGRLNGSQLWRKDGKIFYNRTEKTQESDLAILILTDQSGSMSYARRMENARLGTIMVSEVCEHLNIPLGVMGHTSQFSNPEMRLYHYIAFEGDIASQKHSIAKMEALNDNRDGLALHYALEYLHQQPQRDKILLVINDGLPNHGYDHYYGDATIVDCNNVIKKYEREGITTIGVAIGDGKDEIAKIYKNYISVENLAMLPKKLVSIIERNIFKQN